MKKNKTQENQLPPALAVLVDGENISSLKLKEIVDFAARHGSVIVKRIYGDWSKPEMARWKEAAMEYSFRAVEAMPYIKGKNTTDIVLVIDAMDLLNAGNIGGFCIAASDSDYTPLAQRMREEGFLVLGCGESKTPVAFINSCKKFLYLDKEPEEKAKKKDKTKDKTKETTVFQIVQKPEKGDTPDVILTKEAHLFDKAFEAVGKDEVTLSQLGTELKKLFPKYKPRRYGCKTLGDIYQKLEKYEVIQTGIKGIYNTVRLKEKTEAEASVR